MRIGKLTPSKIFNLILGTLVALLITRYFLIGVQRVTPTSPVGGFAGQVQRSSGLA